MSPRKRRSAVLDADASMEEIEAAAFEAQTRAIAARAHAERLRREALGREKKSAFETMRGWSRPSWLVLPRPALLALCEAVVVIFAALAATGYMMWHHHNVQQDRQRAVEFSAAARQSVVTMMSIDPATAKQNMKDVIANSTGKFKKALEAGEADELVQGAEQSNVSTKATIQNVAVESMTPDSAVVLVAASTEGTGPNNAKLPPASWRMSVTVVRENGQLKTSEFEFV